MIKRLVLVSGVLLMFISGPLLFTPAPAFAGHTGTGQWCECGSPGCTCDPGECQPGMNCVRRHTDNSKKITISKDSASSPANSSLNLLYGVTTAVAVTIFWILTL